MLISQIYHRFRLPPNLQRHMLEVAAVTDFLANHLDQQPLDRPLLVKVALLHDLGNLVKFKDFIIPEMAAQESHWRQVQTEIIKKYGSDAHQATLKMIEELELREEEAILKLLAESDHRFISTYDYLNLENRLLDYADMCVAPAGVVGFEVRIGDLIHRYKLSDNDPTILTRRSNALEIQGLIDYDLNALDQVDWEKPIHRLSASDI